LYFVTAKSEIRSTKSETNGNDPNSKVQTNEARRLDNRVGSAFLLFFTWRKKSKKAEPFQKLRFCV